MVENTTKSQFEILYALSRFLTISEIANYRKTSRAAIYKGINALIQKGLLRKTGRIYEPTDKGREGLHSSHGLQNQFRLHNFAIKVKVLGSKRGWELRKNQLLTLKSFTKSIDLKSGSQEIYNLANIKVKTTPSSIVFYMPTFYGKTPEIALNQALNLFFEAITKVENLFKITLTKDRKFNMTIISQHYAKINDTIAKLYRKEEDKLFITGADGKVWLIADYSFQTDELETIHPINAQDDMNTVSKFFNDLRKNPTTPGQLLQMIQGVVANQVVFDKNMQSHIQAVKDLGSGVRALTKAVEGKKEKKKLSQTSIDKFINTGRLDKE